jgi:glycosyltransferase involved in cell wall biosynthesis
VKVAVVYTDVDPSTGGRFSFQHTLLDALQRHEASTNHEFLLYPRGWNLSTTGTRTQVASRAMTYLTTRAVLWVRDVQDRVLGVRAFSPRTSFERALLRDGIQFVWFLDPYAEPCALPYIFTVFDVEYLRQPWFPEVSNRGEWERRDLHYRQYLRRATRVIVPNEAGLHQVVNLFNVPPERVLQLPHPTPPHALNHRTPVSNRTSRVDQPYLLYPAGSWPHKNHISALEALQQVNSSRTERYSLVLTGADKGNFDHIRDSAVSMGIARDVEILGYVGVTELMELYADAHALLYLSFFGPENVPPLEAFAVGCPVIAADIPGASHQLGDAAILVPPSDTKAIAAAIRSVSDSALRERLVRAGRSRAAERTGETYLWNVVSFLDDFESVRRLWA